MLCYMSYVPHWMIPCFPVRPKLNHFFLHMNGIWKPSLAMGHATKSIFNKRCGLRFRWLFLWLLGISCGNFKLRWRGAIIGTCIFHRTRSLHFFSGWLSKHSTDWAGSGRLRTGVATGWLWPALESSINIFHSVLSCILQVHHESQHSFKNQDNFR